MLRCASASAPATGRSGYGNYGGGSGGGSYGGGNNYGGGHGRVTVLGAGYKVGEVIAWIAKGCTELSYLFILFGAS